MASRDLTEDGVLVRIQKSLNQFHKIINETGKPQKKNIHKWQALSCGRKGSLQESRTHSSPKKEVMEEEFPYMASPDLTEDGVLVVVDDVVCCDGGQG